MAVAAHCDDRHRNGENFAGEAIKRTPTLGCEPTREAAVAAQRAGGASDARARGPFLCENWRLSYAAAPLPLNWSLGAIPFRPRLLLLPMRPSGAILQSH